MQAKKTYVQKIFGMYAKGVLVFKLTCIECYVIKPWTLAKLKYTLMEHPENTRQARCKIKILKWPNPTLIDGEVLKRPYKVCCYKMADHQLHNFN